MVGKYKAYPEYKDSGVGWLGNIPKHWEANKTKWYCKVTDGSHHSPDIQLEGYPFISVTDIGENKIDFCNAKKISKSDYYRLVREGCKPSVGDILLTKDGTIGRACLVNVSMPDFVILSSLGLLTPKQQVLNKFLYYYLISGINIDQMNSMIHGSALRRMTINKINELLFICPEISEQQNIANFLDYETSKIDMLIEKQQQLIKLLEEKRQAVISHAVTKGLNPNVSMKDSGVEWLGEIPEYWEIYRLKTITTLKTSKSCFKNNLIALENIESWSGKYVKTENDYSGDGIAFKAGDILFGKLRPYLAKVYIAESDGEAIGDFFVLRTKPKVISRFLQLCLLTQEVIFIINGSTFGAKMPRVSWEFMGNLSFVIPPLKEQEEIISYLKAEISKLDLLIEKANQTIILLKERRTALISAAVTGKIDVRDWQAPTITV